MRVGPVPPVVGVGLVVLELFFVVLERGAGGALLEQHVERLLDVVGVQLLVEVEDVVSLPRRLVSVAVSSVTTATGTSGRSRARRRASTVVDVDVVVVEVVVDQVTSASSLVVDVELGFVVVEFVFGSWFRGAPSG